MNYDFRESFEFIVIILSLLFSKNFTVITKILICTFLYIFLNVTLQITLQISDLQKHFYILKIYKEFSTCYFYCNYV